MTRRSLVFILVLLAIGIFVPPHNDSPLPEIRCIDEEGRDMACAPAFAKVVEPARERMSPDAILVDFAYAAGAAGPLGVAGVLCGFAFLVLLVGLWCRGVRCAIRRLFVTFALGIPLGTGLIYASCFLDGRNIELGPEATGWVRASLHNQTYLTTGLLTPRQLFQWHYKRGFAVLNVSDKDDTRGGREAVAAAREKNYMPPMLVMVGEEWHAAPDLVLINIKRTWPGADLTIEEAVPRIIEEGGAVYVGHPWSKLERPLDELFDAGVDGIEVVNGVIHGGKTLINSSRRKGKGLIGVIDYKFGPHVNALTLVPAASATSARGVIEALRQRRTRVLYAVPGGAVTHAQWEANPLGNSGAVVGLRTLLEVPHLRRVIWFGWLAGFVLLWWVATRESRERKPISRRLATILFIVCCAIEFALPAGLSWQVRESFGPIPVNLLLVVAAGVALPLLVCTDALSRHEAAR
ncbi:MAG: PHP domain-containing protein [Planctomycetota bacterium]|jgi:predicted metal-dependent phosphoesterase TrpH